jgi:hypothetical protein
VLAGANKPHLLGALRALNGARNHVSHRVESPEVNDKILTFVREIGRQIGRSITWPPDREGQLAVLQDACGEAALAVFDIVINP